MDEATLIEIENSIPFRRSLGIKVLSARDGRSEVLMPWQPDLANRFGGVHGGAIATLVDGTIASALVSLLPPGDRLGATIELSIRYVSAGRGTVRGLGRVIKIGGRIAFGEADVVDEEGNLIAKSQGTFQIIRQRKEQKSDA